MGDKKDIVGTCCLCGIIIYKWSPQYTVNNHLYCIDCDDYIDENERKLKEGEQFGIGTR